MLALVGLLSALAALTPLYAAAAERIVVDWHTALAIGGYDPWRSIPTGNRCPAMPRIVNHLEFTYGGAVWRFSNVGNREAFAARPDVYMPRALAVMIRSALPMALRLRAIGACGW